MYRFGKAVVRLRFVILVLATALILPSVLGMNATRINYDMLTYLPDDLKKYYDPLFCKTEEEAELWKLVKGADKLSALIKCIEERKMGNTDFLSAEKATIEAIHKLEIPEVEVFMEEFIPAYDLTLDEQA